jgi:hypothetical protein
MMRLLGLLLLAVLCWAGYARYEERQAMLAPVAAESRAEPVPVSLADVPVEPHFSCDGRTRCPQMHSCAEAKFFLANCPGVKMDGDHDGVPCEREWCGPG